MAEFLDLTGQKFGKLTALSVARRRPIHWLCRCECGVEKAVHIGSLRSGRAQSCGCRMRAVLKAGTRTTHGGSSTRTYIAWSSMRARCERPSASAYPKYGARGITVCERWKSFENFLADMGERPAGKTLGRIDNNGNYEPSNCRWETPIEQANNRRTSKRLTLNGETLTRAEWSRRLAVPQQELYRRLKLGWPLERVLAPRPTRGGRLISGPFLLENRCGRELRPE